MSDEDVEVVRGSGNIFADFGDADAENKHLKAQVAAEIIRTLSERGFSARAAASADAADIQRIRNADLSRFTLDRLIRIAFRIGRRVELRVLPERTGGSSETLSPSA